LQLQSEKRQYNPKTQTINLKTWVSHIAYLYLDEMTLGSLPTS